MKFKIVNLSKFIRSILVILGIIICISLFISNISFSHTETTYRTICVSNGDTLWSIAKEEKISNSYYTNKDVRDIVNNIKDINKLTNCDLSIGQKLLIPNI
ncbi:MAG: LysM peptidoglycan-binding domain-containing protein [Clostridia bacterium]|nr:LysM peptidoglycan-binding domain-containing protein [Clostridia bacterium]